MRRRKYCILRRPTLTMKKAARPEDQLDQVTQRVADARRQREQLRQVKSANEPEIKTSIPGLAAKHTRSSYLPITLIIISAVLLGWAVVGRQGADSDALAIDPPRPDALNGVATDWLEARIESLNQKLEFVSGQINDLESRLATTDSLEAQIAQLNASIERLNRVTGNPAISQAAIEPDSAAGQLAEPRRDAPATEASAKANPGPGKAGQESAVTVRTASAEDSKLSVQKLYEKDSNSATSIGAGDNSWKINLISSPSREDAIHFANRAKSRGVATEVEQVSVRGTPYWRVQISGFATHDEALAHSNSIKETLGLRDTWIYSN